ncbi:MAG: circularly permuted type 2 ATP-grasp protein [Hyphomicrobiaceae bacterium]|nr:circularly permuted type 2 ATP-grasp protein [Hyphomicrobiaceae bacterium]
MTDAQQQSDLLEAYRNATSSGYDELLDATSKVRPHWQPLLANIQALTPEERAKRAQHLDRRVQDTGIAYDIFADPSKPSRGWRLDLMPFAISAGEWRFLQTSLIQRAQLFDAILADLYGKQSLMKQGLIPPELVFADPSFLRPCLGIVPEAGHLQFYAADLARDAAGQWRVIDNHTETLAGIGFALANRVVHTHVAGDIFKQANALRLASYFQNLQSALTLHCGRENARIALLTPGAHHPDYFSHAYLARYLGYLLVEGPDLRTKGNKICLKTLEGLKEIDLIVRCVDGHSSDPLELDPSGFQGPAGLVRVCRKSPKLVVNAVGTAITQNRALGIYLPQLAKHILGEDLAIYDAPRWWLGDPASQNRVFNNIDDVVIRSAQEGTGRPGQAAAGSPPRKNSNADWQALRRDIALHGAGLVAEEKVGFSVAPTYSAVGLVPRPFAVRIYVAKTANGYEVMPGGLAMTVDPDRAVALSAPDGHARDVWIVSDTEVPPHVSLWRPTVEGARVERSQRVIQSRVADDLFWLGRYCERADWTMRVLRSALRRVEEDGGPANGRRAARTCLEVLLSDPTSTVGARGTRPTSIEIESLCTKLISSGKGYRTLQRTLAGLYRVASLARDRLSHEGWQTLSKFRPDAAWSAALSASSPLMLLDQLDEGLASLAAFNGLMHENMTRNFGWSFQDMGRRLERAYNISEAIHALFIPGTDSEIEANELLLLLELADSFITYRSRYRLDPMLVLVLDLLLLDETNPRSLAFQLAAISSHMETLPDPTQKANLSEPRRLILDLLTSIRLADLEAMGRDGNRKSLDELLQKQLQLLPHFSNAIASHYFNMTDEAPHRVHLRSDFKS